MTGSVLARDKDPEFESPQVILVAGASGGIGQALCEALAKAYPTSIFVRLARDPARLPPIDSPSTDIAFDLLDERCIASSLERVPADQTIDLALIATGWLHDQDRRPEKTYRSLDSDQMLYAYRVNSVGPALLLKHLLPRMNRRHLSRIGVLSARVGSISDNRLGGWHSYRASKAALNMLLKNYAIELAQRRQRCLIVGLQPGTTDTPLSAPFQRSVPPEQLQTPAYTASQLVKVMERLRLADSGQLFDFLGLPFTP